jgi:hypothetical protein
MNHPLAPLVRGAESAEFVISFSFLLRGQKEKNHIPAGRFCVCHLKLGPHLMYSSSLVFRCSLGYGSNTGAQKDYIAYLHLACGTDQIIMLNQTKSQNSQIAFIIVISVIIWLPDA